MDEVHPWLYPIGAVRREITEGLERTSPSSDRSLQAADNSDDDVGLWRELDEPEALAIVEQADAGDVVAGATTYGLGPDDNSAGAVFLVFEEEVGAGFQAHGQDDPRAGGADVERVRELSLGSGWQSELQGEDSGQPWGFGHGRFSECYGIIKGIPVYRYLRSMERW